MSSPYIVWLSSLSSGNNNTAAPTPHTLTLELEGHHSDSIVLNLAPIYSPDSSHSQPPSLMSTFKGGSAANSEGIASPTSPTGAGMGPAAFAVSCSTTTAKTATTAAFSRAQRPTPPNTLNLVSATSHSSMFATSAQGIVQSHRNIDDGLESFSGTFASNSAVNYFILFCFLFIIRNENNNIQ